MTLVFDRIHTLSETAPDKPRMHALVIGIGRFTNSANRPACVDSAKEVIKFLVKHRDHFEAPLASIDCLLSDPRHPEDFDQLARTDPSFDPRKNEWVQSGKKDAVSNTCDICFERVRQNDVVFFYCSSHGVSGRDENGLLVCEDYDLKSKKPSQYLLDVGYTARVLPAALKAGGAWIFMDACQEVIEEISQVINGTNAIKPLEATVVEITSWPVRSVAVAAAPYNKYAHAPQDGGIAYFTETLLHGLENCCVESKSGRWIVTSRQVENTLSQLAFVLKGHRIETARLSDGPPDQRLMPIAEPKIPIAVTTNPEHIMVKAQSVSICAMQISPAIFQQELLEKNDREATWRFALNLYQRSLQIQFLYVKSKRLQDFHLEPPSVHVEVI